MNFRSTYEYPINTVYEIPVGLTASKDFCTREWVVTPSLDLTVVSSIGKTEPRNENARSGFAGYDGSRWRVYGLGADHWGGRGTVNIKMAKSELVELDVSYTLEVRNSFADNRIAAQFSLNF